MELHAHAKLNLSLDVLGKRPDGYHEMKMVMQSISLSDRLTLERREEPGVRVRSTLSFLPVGEKNLAAAAALRFYEALEREPPGLVITLEKHIPVCAGMGGGSSDAAAVLRGLNQLEGSPFPPERLAEIGARVGSDVPYCVLGGTALAQGRGEILTILPPLPTCWAVVCKPEFSISTPELFARLDQCRIRCRPDTAGILAALESGDLYGVARRMYNVFEDVLPPRQQNRIAALKHTLIQYGALGVSMSGTGPTVFGLFDAPETARLAQQRLTQDCPETFLCQTV